MSEFVGRARLAPRKVFGSVEVGWTVWVAEGQQCGTTGQNRQMEAVKIRLVNAPLNCQVRYRVHTKNKGWGEWTYDGAQA